MKVVPAFLLLCGLLVVLAFARCGDPVRTLQPWLVESVEYYGIHTDVLDLSNGPGGKGLWTNGRIRWTERADVDRLVRAFQTVKTSDTTVGGCTVYFHLRMGGTIGASSGPGHEEYGPVANGVLLQMMREKVAAYLREHPAK